MNKDLKKQIIDLAKRFNYLQLSANKYLTLGDPENLMPTVINEMKLTTKLINKMGKELVKTI